MLTENRRRKKKQANPAQLIVNYVENDKNDVTTVTMAIDDCVQCDCNESVKNNNVMMKDTIVEDNGNVVLKETCNDTACSNDASCNDNYILELTIV